MRILGIDYGERRIGLAVSDPTGTLARPLRTIAPRGPVGRRARAVAGEIAALAADSDGLESVVVGLPRRLDGAGHEQTARVLTFVDALRRSVDLPVALQDERLSSVEADARLAARDRAFVRERDWRRRKAQLDAAAAAVILQDYLDMEDGG
ncbi:MAG: Holliday junction resolvase RuvX [Acidobacteria bacterium]|nr:Holliday junction resolvase RuvX [Acidobacteriota bacterium]